VLFQWVWDSIYISGKISAPSKDDVIGLYRV
jgi:hypothetical protein